MEYKLVHLNTDSCQSQSTAEECQASVRRLRLLAGVDGGHSVAVAPRGRHTER